MNGPLSCEFHDQKYWSCPPKTLFLNGWLVVFILLHGRFHVWGLFGGCFWKKIVVILDLPIFFDSSIALHQNKASRVSPIAGFCGLQHILIGFNGNSIKFWHPKKWNFFMDSSFIKKWMLIFFVWIFKNC